MICSFNSCLDSGKKKMYSTVLLLALVLTSDLIFFIA